MNIAATTALPTENVVRAKRLNDSPLQIELGKKRKKESASEGDLKEQEYVLPNGQEATAGEGSRF